MKQRIVGALVLVAVAAVVVPIVFDLRHDNATLERPVDIPPKPKDFTVRVLPLIHPDKEDADAQTPAVRPADAPSDGTDAPRPAPAAPLPPAAVAAVPAPAASAPPAAPAPVSDGPQGWAVQVGSFSSEDRAVALRDRLRHRAFTAFVDRATLEAGQNSYRVEVGPELQRSDAEKLQAKLQRDAKLHGIVVSH